MRLYTAAVSPRRGRSTTATLPVRATRPARVAPHRGPVAATCRCGAERARHELLSPHRDCARCTPQR